jgi:sulfoxide reductase heme-binding subunit YedZ
MSYTNTPEHPKKESPLWTVALIVLVGMLGIMIVSLLALALGYSPIDFVSKALNKLFATDTVQVMWYVTRAAGLTAYLLLWLSTVWGVAVTSKIFDPVLHRMFTYDFHQFLSLLAIGFVILHIVVLLADQYLPFSVAQVLVPFIAPYRPVWVGVGIIGLYLTLLVTITFYIRRFIGQRAFRVIHYLSFLAFLATAAHGLLAGTDSALPATRVMYFATTLVVVFLTAYRIFAARATRNQPAARHA